MVDYEVSREFDACGLRCPMPILKAKKEIKEIEIGQILKILATDVGTKKDFPAWAARTGNEILELVEDSDKLVWYIRRVN
ncbi:MAG: sulfurtransferase TusA family protein [Candidatus Thorarchaeota archaeon]|jgi:tRNA 2-thiouridine synthesizing protein A